MTAAEDGWLLRAWERGSTAEPPARGAVLCAAAGMTATVDEALDLPVGTLAATLARTHRETFAPSASGVLTCQRCAEVLDVDVPLDVLADAPPATEQATVTTPSGRVLHVRVPTTRDLLVAGERDDVLGALVERCVHDAETDGTAPVAIEGDDLAAADDALENLAGAAAVRVRAVCPACGAQLSAPVDVAEFVWERVQQQAPDLLADIADLARSFGWTEEVILALPRVRRRSYLALVREPAQ